MVDEVRISQAQRDMMAQWLPQRSFSEFPVHARALFAEMAMPAVRGETLMSVERELSKLVVDFREGMSWLEYFAPIGRGEPSRGLAFTLWPRISTWERIYAYALGALTLRDPEATHWELERVRSMLALEPIDALLASMLCMPTLERAQALFDQCAAHRTLAQHPMVLWLRGEPPRSLDSEPVFEAALDCAFEGRWKAALDALPPKLQSARSGTIKPGFELAEVAQCTAQLITHAALSKPTKRVLDRSIAVLFAFGTLPTHPRLVTATCVRHRATVLALYRSIVCPKTEPLALLYSMRAHNAHVVQPIDLQPRAPQEAWEILDALLALVRDAIDRRKALVRGPMTMGMVFYVG
jgi:hypothetical protein